MKEDALVEHYEVFIQNTKEIDLYLDCRVINENAPNVLFCCTPLTTVTYFSACYTPFAEKGFNVFAFDFTGVGQSKGNMKDFSIQMVLDDFESCIRYIQSQSTGKIYLFGDTGIGGIIAQYYACASTDLAAFAQFGPAIYQDFSPMGIPAFVVKVLSPFVRCLAKLFPSLRVRLSVPKYDGVDAEKDNEFYSNLIQEDPDIFKVTIAFLNTLLFMFNDKNSLMKKPPNIPTLVYKTLYDRYFPPDYFDRYYDSLNGEKEMVVVSGTHNSYYFMPELFAVSAANWFHKH